MSDKPSVLFYGGNIHTVHDARPRATWFTVLGERIQRTGAGDPPPTSKSVNLEGRTVVPGFVDSHIHFFQTGLDRLFIDVSGATTVGEVESRLTSGVVGKRGWVFAHSFEEDKLSDLDMLTRHELDRAFPDRPVWVNRVDYHSAIVNTYGLKRLELPAGLSGMLVGPGGEPTGVLRADAYLEGRARVQRQYPVWVREKAIKEAVRVCVRRGITAVHALEGGRLFGDEGVHVLLSKMDQLPLDLTMFLQEKNVFFTKKLGFEHLGGCILVDGSIGSWTAALDEPYHGCPGVCGSTYETARTLGPFIMGAHHAGAQLAFHAIGEKAIDVVLDCYEKAILRRPRYDHRHRIEHFELATDAQMDRAAELGIVVAMQPTFELFWGGPGGMYASRLGDRWKRTNRLRTILERGLVIAGGSDANVTPPDPLLGMHAAVNHPNEDERISPAQALRMMTLDAAFGAHNDDRHGSLAPGKEASFAVLEDDPLTIDPTRIKDIRVLETWVKGKRVHRAGHEDPEWDEELLSPAPTPGAS